MSLKLRQGIRPGRRPLTCHHEAGHAVAIWSIGLSFDKIIVLTTQQFAAGDWPIDRQGHVVECEGLVLGCHIGPCLFETPGMYQPVDPDWLRRKRHAAELSLVVNLAGIYAEARFRKQSPIVAMTSGGNVDMEHYSHTLDTWFPDRAEQIAVAQSVDRQVKNLIRSHKGWNAISSVAAALYSCGRLTWHAADKLCQAAYGWAGSYTHRGAIEQPVQAWCTD